MTRFFPRLAWTAHRILLAILLLAALLRAWAALQLPVDFDKPTYTQVGFDYAAALKAGDAHAAYAR